MNAEKTKNELAEILARLTRATLAARQDITKNANFHYAPFAPEKNG